MNKVDRAQLDLELLLPYVNYLKDVVNQSKRMELRKQQKLIYGEEVVIFPNPFEIGKTIQDVQKRFLEPYRGVDRPPRMTEEMELMKVRKELEEINNGKR